MRYLPAVALLAAAMLAAPLLANEATPPAAPPAPKKVVCSESFETGSLVKSYKRCAKVRKRTEPKTTAVAAPAPEAAPAEQTAPKTE